MKRFKKLVVIFMCMSFLLSLFGCKAKDKYILDGPGMVNSYAWDSFDISRSGDSYAQHNFDITVSYSEKGYVVKGTLLGYEESEGILLPKSACKQSDALDPGGLPDVTNTISADDMEDVIILDAPDISIHVGYVDGRCLPKVDEDDFSIKVYEIVYPYFEDKYD